MTRLSKNTIWYQMGPLYFFSTLLSFGVFAEPVVIYDSGSAISAVKYKIYLRPDEVQPIDPKTRKKIMEMALAQQAKALGAAPKIIAEAAASIFPHKTPDLTLGKVIPRQLNKPEITAPFFMLGTDAKSRQWLRKNLEMFKKTNAMGFIVEAPNLAEVKQLRQEGQGLTMFMISGSAIVQALGITHYPVYVSSTVMIQ